LRYHRVALPARVALDDADGLVAEPFIEAVCEQVVGVELDEPPAQSAGPGPAPPS
jgi:hypothetical protein